MSEPNRWGAAGVPTKNQAPHPSQRTARKSPLCNDRPVLIIPGQLPPSHTCRHVLVTCIRPFQVTEPFLSLLSFNPNLPLPSSVASLFSVLSPVKPDHNDTRFTGMLYGLNMKIHGKCLVHGSDPSIWVLRSQPTIQGVDRAGNDRPSSPCLPRSRWFFQSPEARTCMPD